MNAAVEAMTDLAIKAPDSFFIGGEWASPAANDKLNVISPVTEETVMSFAAATPADVDSAVAAARQAFDTGPWPRMSAEERGDMLLKVAKELEGAIGPGNSGIIALIHATDVDRVKQEIPDATKVTTADVDEETAKDIVEEAKKSDGEQPAG